MKNEDEYIVKIHDDGTRFYYKNKQLHRETGPAVINPKDVEKYKDLSDESLYQEVHVSNPSKKGKMNTIYTENGPIITYESPIEHIYSTAFYLNDIPYLENEFNAIILEKELQNSNNNKSKKIKL
jgi:hypothetical protein